MLAAAILSTVAWASAAEPTVASPATASMDLTGTIVGARFRCEGMWCPQWALDVTRYDPIRYVNTSYTYDLIELLPLAPTSERSGILRTAYDEASRIFTVAAADYPEAGMDAVWTVKISDDVTSASAVTTNVLFAHPDTAVGSQGKLQLKKILAAPASGTIAIFDCGGIMSMNHATGQYTKIGSVFGQTSNVGWVVSDAHVVDGSKLKSFLLNNANGETYVVVTDLSDPAAAVSGPLVQVKRPQGMRGALNPQAAHMFTKPGETQARLMLLEIGSFDYFALVDEATGDIELAVNNLADSTSKVDLECNAAMKECDMWQTSAVDPVSGSIWYQAHDVSTDEKTLTISTVQYTTSKVDPDPYALSWITIEPMEGGFYGYQWVPYAV